MCLCLYVQITAVKNEALDVAAVVAQYQREVAALKAQLAALSGELGTEVNAGEIAAEVGGPTDSRAIDGI